MPVPASSGCAGHPLFAHNAAISATIVGSVTRRASPETITSKPLVATLIAQRGSRATFFALRVRSPVWNQYEPACQSAPTLVTCGLPSAFRVVSQDVERFGERGSSCVRRSASCVSTWDHSIVGSPSASLRFVVFIVLETPLDRLVPRHRRSPGQGNVLATRPRGRAVWLRSNYLPSSADLGVSGDMCSDLGIYLSGGLARSLPIWRIRVTAVSRARPQNTHVRRRWVVATMPPASS